jgi:hypothetical protein
MNDAAGLVFPDVFEYFVFLHRVFTGGCFGSIYLAGSEEFVERHFNAVDNIGHLAANAAQMLIDRTA